MTFQCFCVRLQNFGGELKTGDWDHMMWIKKFHVERNTFVTECKSRYYIPFNRNISVTIKIAVLQMNQSKFVTG